MNSRIQQACSAPEPSITASLRHLLPIIDPEFRLLSEFHRERQYYDEPKFWHYTARLNDKFIPDVKAGFKSVGAGCSFFSQETALVKCLAEVVERYCNNYFSDAFIEEISEAKKIQNRIIPIDSFARFSRKQLQKRELAKYVIKQTSKLRWTTCQSLTSDSSYLVPCNLIYLAYPHANTEPYIYPSISTGVAAGGTVAAAVIRGIYECVERDAFMISYLRKIRNPRICIETMKDTKIVYFRNIASQYNMELFCFDITTDIGIPTVCAVVLDKTGVGKAVSIGLKSNIDMAEAIIGAITEAFHTRGWIRHTHELNNDEYRNELKNAKDPGIIMRGMFWFDVDKIPLLNFWLKNPVTTNCHSTIYPKTKEKELQFLVDKLVSKKIDIYWKDIILPELSNVGLHIVKTILPQLQPLTFDDDNQPQESPRLFNVPEFLGYEYSKQINMFPHPFV